MEYRLFIFSGADPDREILEITSGKFSTDQVITSTKTNPIGESTTSAFQDLALTDIFSSFLDIESSSAENARVNFSINRNSEECFTPRRNPEVEKTFDFWMNFQIVYNSIFSIFRNFWQTWKEFDDRNFLSQIEAHVSSVFLPVLPLLDKSKEDQISNEDGTTEVVTFSAADQTAFINEFNRSVESMLTSLEETLHNLVDVKRHSPLLGIPELRLLGVITVGSKLSELTRYSIQSVEDELRRQLVAAIGKECTVKDIDSYMTFHYAKLYNQEFLPAPFCYDVRRPGHTPEGSVSVECDDTFVNTVYRVREYDALDAPSMKFALNAATNVKFRGRQYLHGMVLHKFSTQNTGPYNLSVRARQFSGFVVLLGNIAGPEKFDAKHSLIVQNKDAVRIPLLFEAIPSAKEFKDAILSLSPEQQSFAKAFREMQLESSLFGVLIVPIKPLMEKLLNLSEGSLTKEIRLTQDLMRLFIEYQVPSDLLTYSGPDSSDTEEKIRVVTSHVNKLNTLIKESNQEELERQRERTEYAVDDHIQNVVSTRGRAEAPSALSTAGERFGRRKGASGRVLSKGSIPTEDAAFSDFVGTAEFAPAPRAMAMMAMSTQSMPPTVTGGGVAPDQVTPTPEPRQGKFDQTNLEINEGEMSDLKVVNYTQIPKLLDRRFETLKESAKVRPTTISIGEGWSRQRQKSLLAPPKTEWLGITEQKRETSQAMDLIDALSRSGEIVLSDCDLHVIVAMTHCFDETVMDTVIRKNYNPVQAIETTNLVMNSMIQGQPLKNLVNVKSYERLKGDHPSLLQLQNS